MVDFVDGATTCSSARRSSRAGSTFRAPTRCSSTAPTCFGLAQLYQLRGRIGRAQRARVLLPHRPRGDQDDRRGAKKRLAVLQRFTELGAGFQIASHDLEIRGAGDLLGAEQSGAIAAVGFETYTPMLEEAVAELRGEPITGARSRALLRRPRASSPTTTCPTSASVSTFYRRLAGARRGRRARDARRDGGPLRRAARRGAAPRGHHDRQEPGCAGSARSATSWGRRGWCCRCAATRRSIRPRC